MATNLIAYHGDKKLKSRFLKEMRWHRDQDMIVKGTYGKQNGKWRGCAVGCSIHSMSRLKNEELEWRRHSLYEPLLGFPEWLAHLEDAIFEELPDDSAPDFPIQLAASIKAGAGLDWVKPRFIIFVLNDCRPNAFDDGKAAIDQTIGLWQLVADNERVTEAQWSAAESAARSAARSARSARSAAESAAWSARSAAWSAVWSAAFERYRDELLRLLKECPVVECRQDAELQAERDTLKVNLSNTDAGLFKLAKDYERLRRIARFRV